MTIKIPLIKNLQAILVILFASVLTAACSAKHQEAIDKQEILDILRKQEKAWNKNDLPGFMEAYWNSDSLTFYSGAVLKKGWKTTLESYLKSYPDTSHTGKLHFKIATISAINEDAYWVMGEYHLKRAIGDSQGTFMIIFKKIQGAWKIIADSSC